MVQICVEKKKKKKEAAEAALGAAEALVIVVVQIAVVREMAPFELALETCTPEQTCIKRKAVT